MRKGVSAHRLNTPPAKMASIVIHEFKPVKRKVDLISNQKESRFSFNALIEPGRGKARVTAWAGAALDITAHFTKMEKATRSRFGGYA